MNKYSKNLTANYIESVEISKRIYETNDIKIRIVSTIIFRVMENIL